MNKEIEEMARAGYERMFEDKWDDLKPNSIERDLWRETAKEMLKAVKFPAELYKICRSLCYADIGEKKSFIEPLHINAHRRVIVKTVNEIIRIINAKVLNTKE